MAPIGLATSHHVIDHTIFLKRRNDAEQVFEDVNKTHPDHVSVVIGSPEDELAYQVTAETVLRIFHANLGVSQQFVCLRYPSFGEKNVPQSLDEFFHTYPVINYFDQVPSVDDSLIKASPNLREYTYEYENDDSAMRIFSENWVSEESVLRRIEGIFKKEKVSPAIYKPYLQELIDQCPRSGRAGILVHVLFPKEFSVGEVLYCSTKDGIPIDRQKEKNDPSVFFQNEPRRILASALFARREEVVQYRYSMLSPEEFAAYHGKVKGVIQKMYVAHLLASAELESLKQRIFQANDLENEQKDIEKLLNGYLHNHDPDQAYGCLIQCSLPSDVFQEYVVRCASALLTKSDWKTAEEALTFLPEGHPKKLALTAFLCEVLLETTLATTAVDPYLAKMPEGIAKNYVLGWASTYVDDPDRYLEKRNVQDYPYDLNQLNDALTDQIFPEAQQS